MNITITNDLLDQIFEEARLQATKSYDDAKLEYFSLQFIPFSKKDPENVYLMFYSGYADRHCVFSFGSDDNFKLKQPKPDKHGSFYMRKKTFDTRPWKENSNWIDFVQKYCVKDAPFHPNEGTYVSLYAHHYKVKKGFFWALVIVDGYTGREYRYYWNGKEISDENVSQTTPLG